VKQTHVSIFSLDDVVQSVNVFHQNKMNLLVVVDSQVPGQILLHPLETSSDKRPDVTVYDSSYTKVVLLVEVQSSLMRE